MESSNNSSTTNNTLGGQSTATNTAESPSHIKSRSNQNPILNEAEMFSKLIENNLGKRKKSSRSKKINSNMTYNKNLDVWLENSLKGCETNGLDNVYDYTTNVAYQNLLLNNLSTMQRNTNSLTDSLSLPPQINHFDLPHSSSYLSQQPSQHQSPQHNNYIPRPDNSLGNFNEFVSLPPLLMHRMQNIEKKASFERNEEQHFSDQNISGSSNTSSTDTNKLNPEKLTESNENNIDNSAILVTLLKQINLLHETNTKICKNLHDTKVEMDSLKHSSNWNYRHRRDSVSGLSTASQPIGYPIGTHSPAPTYRSQGSSYAPGMVTDVIREIREASRIREEALLNRVKAMIDEKSWGMNESNLRIVRDVEDIKLQIQQIKYESKQTMERFSHIEDEIKSLKLLLSHAINSNLLQQQQQSHQSVTIERDIMKSPSVRLNDNINKSRRNSLNLNYAAVLTNNNDFNSLDDIDEIKLNQANVYGVLYTDDNKHHKLTVPNINNSNGNKKFVSSPQHNSNIKIIRTPMLGDDITEERRSEGDEQLMQLEKDTLELRRELQDAVASRKQAENRIMSLENIVTTLQNRAINPVNGVTISTGGRQTDNNSHHHNMHLLSDNANNNSNKRHSLSVSPKPQKAAQIQSVSPKNLQQSSTSNSICLSGPVTDL